MKEIMDMKPLNAEQMYTARRILKMSQGFCDEMMATMKDSGLWQKGFTLKLHVCPTMEVLTEDIQMYRTVEDGDGLFEEEIERVKGCNEGEKWETNPICTSREFIHLFDGTQNAAGTGAGKESEKPLPPDSLCVGCYGNTDPVDSRNAVDGYM